MTLPRVVRFPIWLVADGYNRDNTLTLFFHLNFPSETNLHAEHGPLLYYYLVHLVLCGKNYYSSSSLQLL